MYCTIVILRLKRFHCYVIIIDCLLTSFDTLYFSTDGCISKSLTYFLTYLDICNVFYRMAFYDSFSWNWSAKCHSQWWMCELCWHITKNRICRGYWAKVRNCLTDVSFCSFVIVTKLTRSSAVALIAYVAVGSAKNSLLLDFCFYRYLLWLWHLDPWIKMLIQALL